MYTCEEIQTLNVYGRKAAVNTHCRNEVHLLLLLKERQYVFH
jgi:hypothetical protein